LTLVEDGVFVISLETEAGKIPEAISAVLAELQGLASLPATGEELARARALTGKGFLDRQESSGDLASLLTSFELYSGDYRLRDAYLANWSRMTPLDLARLAQKIFTPENLTATILLPANSPELETKKLESLLSELKLTIPESAPQAASTFEEFKLKGGTRVFIMRDPTLPLVTVRTAVMGGLLAESEGQDGLSNLMSMVWPKASTKLNSEEFSRAVEDLGAFVEAISGRNSIGLVGSFMASNWQEGLGLLTDVLRSPAFSEDNTEEARLEVLASLKLQDEQVAERLFKILRQKLFGKHPYHLNALGTPETVSGFTKNTLLSFYRSLVRPDNLVIAVAGDVEPKVVIEVLEDYLKDWQIEEKVKPVTVPEPPTPLAAKVSGKDALESAQTHLGLAFLVPGLGHPDQAPLEVLDAYLSGMGGVLFNELRNKRSLAYTVGSSYNAGLNAAAFSFYIASDPSKTGEALSGMLGIIGDLSDKPLTDQVVAGAIRYVTGLQKIRLQTLGSRADQTVFNNLYGLGADFDRRHLAEIEAVKASDVQRVAKKYLNPEVAAMVVVGNEKSVEDAYKAFE
jgi:zinc protease